MEEIREVLPNELFSNIIKQCVATLGAAIPNLERPENTQRIHACVYMYVRCDTKMWSTNAPFQERLITTAHVGGHLSGKREKFESNERQQFSCCNQKYFPVGP